MPRTRFLSDAPNRATVRAPHEYLHSYIETEYFAPATGGYVKYDWANPNQICQRLSHYGDTLIWQPSMGPLVDLLRREHRRARRAARRS